MNGEILSTNMYIMHTVSIVDVMCSNVLLLCGYVTAGDCHNVVLFIQKMEDFEMLKVIGKGTFGKV